MSRATRLQPIADLADEEARSAAAALGELRGRYEQEQGRLRELQSYRDEYACRLGGDAAIIRGGQLRDLQAFLAQLNQAVAQQEVALVRIEAELDQYQEAWRAKNARAKAMDKVIDGHRRTERRQDQHREQQAVDEHNGRRTPPGTSRA